MTAQVPDVVPPPVVVPVVPSEVVVVVGLVGDDPHAATAAALAAAVSAPSICLRLTRVYFLSCIQEVYGAIDASDRLPRSLHIVTALPHAWLLAQCPVQGAKQVLPIARVLPHLFAVAERGVEHAAGSELAAPRHQQVRRRARLADPIVGHAIHREERMHVGAAVAREAGELVGAGEAGREGRDAGAGWG